MLNNCIAMKIRKKTYFNKYYNYIKYCYDYFNKFKKTRLQIAIDSN